VGIPPYANEDQVQSVQLPMTEPNLNEKINLVQNMHGGILKMIATNGFLTAPECTKFVFGRGPASDPAVGAYDAPPDPLVGWGGKPPPHSPLGLGRNLCTHNIGYGSNGESK